MAGFSECPSLKGFVHFWTLTYHVKMEKRVSLEFQGYTWDDYFYAIANKTGILVVYRGGLDMEGFVKMDEILYIAESDRLSKIYESEVISKIRKSISPTDRLFFSYAEITDDNRNEVVSCIKRKLNLTEDDNDNGIALQISCQGACALFPEEFLNN